MADESDAPTAGPFAPWSYDGTNMTNRMSEINHRVVCGIGVENCTKWALEDPRVTANGGLIHTPPQIIEPRSTDAMFAHNKAQTATGSYGTVTWKIKPSARPDACRSVVVMWCAPFNFDFFRNWLAVGITHPGTTDHQESFFDEMYVYDKGDGAVRYTRKQYSDENTAIEIFDEELTVDGSMGMSHRPEIKISVRQRFKKL
ncbi:tereporin-Ca1-like [Haliotis rubra]|uniref:tereporin-Ca1-like n=1 Tax=Haliotis rubra TaxID=36100 RepID=UPI001EE6182F|nr:tereporin-Ca1-like [Haliotis rubra]